MSSDSADRISQIFKDKTIFLSGASGFLGKLIIEKLLRCTEIKKIYMLVREKRGKTPQDRLEDIFGNICFSGLKKQNPGVFKKCSLVPGDVSEIDLGISREDREILKKEVNYIFHSAATTRFDDTMKYAVTMNTRGTKFMLDLAKECTKLELFIHISTAYAFPNEKKLYERFYDPPADPEIVLNSIDWIKEDNKGVVTKQLLGNIPNTYTFSKALAEELVRREVGKIPLILTRPALVVPCFREPIPGWLNSMQGPFGLFAGAGKGVIRTMYMDINSYANLIPADGTINAIFVSMWDYLSTKKQNVFNICMPQQDFKMSWFELIEMGRDIVTNEIPFNQMLWYPGGTPTKSRFWFYFNFLLFQIIPAIFVDFFVSCLGYKRFLLDINIRIYKSQDMFEYYANKCWDFDTSYFLNLRRQLNSIEKQKYKVDSDGEDVKKYLINCVMFCRRHVFKETDDMLPAAKRKIKLLFLLDRTVKILFFAIVFKYIYKCIVS